jgi:hypothetical protein
LTAVVLVFFAAGLVFCIADVAFNPFVKPVKSLRSTINYHTISLFPPV